MKKSFMTRVLATGLSLAMALSLSTATNLVSAQAAPAMLVDAVSGESTSTLTVDVDTVAKLKINPEVSKTYKVESVKKSSKKIKTAVNKKGTVVYVRGMAATGEKDSAIRVYFKVKKTGKTAKRQFTAKVKVVEKEAPKPTCVKLIGAAQKEAKKVAVTFDNAVITKGAISAFKVVRTEGNVTIPVKSVVYDEDKKGAAIELYNAITDGKEYSVTYTDADEAKTESTATFTATDNKVAEIKLDRSTIVAKTADDVNVKTYDAQDVLLGTYTLTQAEANKMTIEVKSANNTGYRAGDKVYVAAVGDVLNVKVTLHTYKYENGVEVGTIERSFDLTGATEDYAAISYGYSISNDAVNFGAASYKQNTSVAKSNNGASVWFNFKKGTTDKNALFTVESSDNSVAIIAKTQLTSTVKSAAIKPVAEGSAYIVVRDASGNLVTTLPFSVGAASKASSISLSSSSVTTSDASGIDPVDVWVTVKDQYETKLTLKNVKVEATDSTTAASAQAITQWNSGAGKIVVANADSYSANKTISYAYKVTAETDQGNLVAYLNVTVLHGSNTDPVASYGLILSKTSVDLAVGKDDNHTTATQSAITVKIGKYNAAGACIGYLDIPASKAAISVVSTDNAKSLGVVSAGTVAEIQVATNSNGAVAAAAGTFGAGETYKKIATAGKTYTVTAKFTVAGQSTTLIQTFDVKDTQGTFTFKVKDNTKAATIDNLQVFKGGDEITDSVKIESMDSVTSGKVTTIKSINFVYKVGNHAFVFVNATPDGAASVSITLP